MRSAVETLRLNPLRLRLLKVVVCIALAISLPGCGDDSPRELVPDTYPVGTRVTLKYRSGEFVLGPKSAQLFLEMLANTPIRSQISMMPAAPWGEFAVDGNRYYWHGNAVIRGKGERERLWHGPLLQRLIYSTSGRSSSLDSGEMQSILDKLENDPTVRNTPLEGPGAYPGGGDALHPITDIKDFKTFTPSSSRGNESTQSSNPPSR